MSGGEEDFLTPTFHEVVFALIRWKLDEFDADPVGYIERERANHPESILGWENPTGNKK